MINLTRELHIARLSFTGRLNSRLPLSLELHLNLTKCRQLVAWINSTEALSSLNFSQRDGEILII